MGNGYSASTPSIDGSAHLLIELAGTLYAGRMDGENATLCRAPRSHPEISDSVVKFAKFSQDQYSDLVALLTALSTKLSATGQAYVKAEGVAQGAIDRVLRNGQYVPPGRR